MSKVLRVKIYQPSAHYRIPFSYQRRFSYPIPPYSTVKGLLCNLLGIKSDGEDTFRKIKDGLSLCVYGKYESIVKEYVWFRNLDKESHTKRFGAINRRFIDFTPQHPGGQAPVVLDVLQNVDITIYVFHPEISFLEKILEAFLDPKDRLSSIHLGRAEDWIYIKEVKIIEPVAGKVYPTNLFTWFPDPKNIIYGFLQNGEKAEEFLGNYRRFYEELNANIFRLGLFYEILDGQRKFTEYIVVKLYEGQGFRPFNYPIDQEEGLGMVFY